MRSNKCTTYILTVVVVVDREVGELCSRRVRRLRTESNVMGSRTCCEGGSQFLLLVTLIGPVTFEGRAGCFFCLEGTGILNEWIFVMTVS